MVERKVGTVIYWHSLSSLLAIFRLIPESGSQFPEYTSGQYIALRRDDCKLTKKMTRSDGKPEYIPDIDEHGNQRRGPVTHAYSISSAPFETVEKGYLEFYIILEKDAEGHPGRLTESLFRIVPQIDDKIIYVDRITGDFTLEKRAVGFRNVVLVGTGTGLAPFASMVKQLHFDAAHGKNDSVKYTLLYTNRTYEELGYHNEMAAIDASGKFDFLYVPSVSRPLPRDLADPEMGKGRANNLLRHIMEMPLREEQDVEETAARGQDVSKAKTILDKTVRPVLPQRVSRKRLQERMDPQSTVILTCGNPLSMADIKYIADANQIHFEKEDW